jgi:hypothetical protein
MERGWKLSPGRIDTPLFIARWGVNLIDQARFLILCLLPRPFPLPPQQPLKSGLYIDIRTSPLRLHAFRIGKAERRWEKVLREGKERG